MSSVPSVAWMDGRLVPFADAAIPIEDRGLQFGESLYEVAAVTAGRVRLLTSHALRMQQGAEELGLADGVPPPDAWLSIFSALHERDPVQEAFMYAQLTGGVAPRAHLPRERPRPRFWCYLRPFRYPRAEDVERGVRAITSLDARWGRCDLKTPMLLAAVLAKREAARRGAGEVIFIGPDGEVREGGSSTVLLVEGRTLVSPAQTRHLLPGTTGPRIQRLAADAGLEVRSEEVTQSRLAAADELMVASTTFLVMPVTHLDDAPVGEGRAGPVASDLARRLRDDLQLP